MPTPIPSNQIITAVKETVDTAFQQGAIGVLLLFMFGVAVFAVAILVYVARRPAKATGERDVNIALSTMADKASARAEKKNDELHAQNQQHNREMKEMGDRFLCALEDLTKANMSIAGHQQAQISEVGAVKSIVSSMNTVGSAPLQGLVVTASSIKEDTARIPTLQNTIEELCRQIEMLIKNQADCAEATEAARKLEKTVLDKAKKSTGLNATIIVPEQTLNVLPDDSEAASLPKAS
jgi:septal ring factor EnvC (AmiA/AmiB activator)